MAGWLLIAYSLLIKPQAAVLLPLMAAFVFVDPARRRARLIAQRRRESSLPCSSRSPSPSRSIRATRSPHFPGSWAGTRTDRTSIRSIASTRSICGRFEVRSGSPTPARSALSARSRWDRSTSGESCWWPPPPCWCSGDTSKIAAPEPSWKGARSLRLRSSRWRPGCTSVICSTDCSLRSFAYRSRGGIYGVRSRFRSCCSPICSTRSSISTPWTTTCRA